MSTPLGTSSNLVITLGVLLKLLGFFVVMYSYAEFVPAKVSQAEHSLTQRFNISITLPNAHSGERDNTLKTVQELGRSYQAIGTQLKTQIDLFSQKQTVNSDELVMSLPAEQVLTLSGNSASSSGFPQTLSETLKQNLPQNFHYILLIKGIGGDPDEMMRALGGFAQDMVASEFAQSDLSIGYQNDTSAPMVEFHVKAESISHQGGAS